MPIDTEARIRDRAYALWETAGRPEGQDKEFWSAAERELAEESGLDRSAEDAETRLPPLVAGLPIH
jgi:hypothetical protein